MEHIHDFDLCQLLFYSFIYFIHLFCFLKNANLELSLLIIYKHVCLFVVHVNQLFDLRRHYELPTILPSVLIKLFSNNRVLRSHCLVENGSELNTFLLSSIEVQYSEFL